MRCGWLVGLAMVVGCSKKVEVSYTEAARIDLGGDVRDVLVVERVGASDTGGSVIDIAEGVFTGEGLDGDADATSAAISGLVDTLRTTGRFDVTEIRVNGRGVDQGLWGGTMAPKQVIKTCKQSGCDAIIAVDALDTDTMSTISVDRDKVFGPSYDGHTNTNLTATFRVYEADGSLQDESKIRLGTTSSVYFADSRAEASTSAATAPQNQSDLAYQAGAEYGARISPHTVVEQRKLYTTGSPELRDAWDRVKAHDMPGAVAIWTKVSKGDDKDAAKAKYNLAVAKERRGKLDEARTLAKAAEKALSKSRTRDYVAELNARVRNEKVVDAQMAAVEGTSGTR